MIPHSSQHKVPVVACFRLERALMGGCIAPTHAHEGSRRSTAIHQWPIKLTEMDVNGRAVLMSHTHTHTLSLTRTPPHTNAYTRTDVLESYRRAFSSRATTQSQAHPLPQTVNTLNPKTTRKISLMQTYLMMRTCPPLKCCGIVMVLIP